MKMFLILVILHFLVNFTMQEEILLSIQLDSPITPSKFQKDAIWIVDRVAASPTNNRFSIFLYSNISECVSLRFNDMYDFEIQLWYKDNNGSLRVQGLLKNNTITNLFGFPNSKYVKSYCCAPMSTNLTIPYTDYENYLILAEIRQKISPISNFWCLKNVKADETDVYLKEKYEQVLEDFQWRYLGKNAEFRKVDTKDCPNVIHQSDKIVENAANLCMKFKVSPGPANVKVVYLLLVLLVTLPLIWSVVYLGLVCAYKRSSRVAPIN